MAENTENKNVRNMRTALEILQSSAVKAAKKGDWGFLLVSDTSTLLSLFKGNDQLKLLVAREVERQGFDFLRYFPEEVLAEIMSQPTTAQQKPAPQQAPAQPAQTPQQASTPSAQPSGQPTQGNTQQTPVQPTQAQQAPTHQAPARPAQQQTAARQISAQPTDRQEWRTWFSKETIIFGGVLLLSLIVFFWSLVVGKSRALALVNLLQIAGPCLAGMQRRYVSAFIPQKVLWVVLIWITPGSWINLFLAPALLIAMLLQRDEPEKWSIPTEDGEFYHFHPITRLGLVDISRTIWLNRRGDTLEMYDRRWFNGQPSIDLSTLGDDVDCNANFWLTLNILRRVDTSARKEGKDEKFSFICSKAKGEQMTRDLQDLRDWTCKQRGIVRHRHS